MRYKEGSVSVFFALLLPLVFSLFFCMLEVTRYQGMSRNSQETTEIILQNIMSEYDRCLWERYGVLALDMGYLTENGNTDRLEQRMRSFGVACTSEDLQQNYFTALQTMGCQAESFRLLTDDGGGDLIRQGAQVMKEEGRNRLLEEWMKQAQDISEEGIPNVAELVLQAKEAIGEAKEAGAETTNQEKTQSGGMGEETSDGEDTAWDDSKGQSEIELKDDPLEVFEQWKQMGILALVMETEDISSSCMDLENVVSHRSLLQGNGESSEEIHMAQKVLFGEYVVKKCGCYTTSVESQGLTYQAEYIIAGKDSDAENLESVAKRLLGIREIANLITLASDQQLRTRAMEVAAALGGATAGPVCLQAVQVGVLAVWAFVESVLDVRLLLQGGQVAAVKSAADWTSDLLQLGQYLPVSCVAKEKDGGMSYEDYLRGMLSVMETKKLGLRSCDVIERELQLREECPELSVDRMISGMSVVCNYQGQTLFGQFVTLSDGVFPSYSFTREAEMDYQSY